MTKSRSLVMGAIAAGVLAGCTSAGSPTAAESTTSSETERTTETTTAETTTAVSTDDATAAGERVQEFYEAYLQDPQTADHWVGDGYITPAAAESMEAFEGADLVTCSQDPLEFSEYEFSEPVLESGTGTMSVRGSYDFMTVEVGLGLLEADGEWRINAFECQA